MNNGSNHQERPGQYRSGLQRLGRVQWQVLFVVPAFPGVDAPNKWIFTPMVAVDSGPRRAFSVGRQSINRCPKLHSHSLDEPIEMLRLRQQNHSSQEFSDPERQE